MQGSTKHLICWSLGHGVRQPKSEANNEVISFAEEKKIEQREIYTQKTTWQNNLGKKLRYRLGGHTLIMIGWWYQKSNSNELKTACPFH